jgi:hypothetical protein
VSGSTGNPYGPRQLGFGLLRRQGQAVPVRGTGGDHPELGQDLARQEYFLFRQEQAPDRLKGSWLHRMPILGAAKQQVRVGKKCRQSRSGE